MDAVEAPDNGGHQHNTSSNPRQHQELAPLAGANPDVVAVLVDNFAGFNTKGSGNGTCDSNHKESKPVHHDIDKGPQSPFEEDRSQCGQKCDRDQGDRDAVKHKGCVRCCLERLQSIINVLGPIELVKVDVHPTLVQLFLKDFLGIERIHRRPIRAAGDILADVGTLQRRVRDRARNVVTLAEVQKMRAVEVVKAEVFRERGQRVLDLVLDRRRDVVNEGAKWVVGIAAAAATAVCIVEK